MKTLMMSLLLVTATLTGCAEPLRATAKSGLVTVILDAPRKIAKECFEVTKERNAAGCYEAKLHDLGPGKPMVWRYTVRCALMPTDEATAACLAHEIDHIAGMQHPRGDVNQPRRVSKCPEAINSWVASRILHPAAGPPPLPPICED